jgi:hypothetical protein
MRVSELESHGVPRSQAITQVRQEFGSLLRIKEDSREAWQFPILEQMVTFAIVSILWLPLGIGATTANCMVSFRVTDTAGHNVFSNYLLLTLSGCRPLARLESIECIANGGITPWLKGQMTRTQSKFVADRHVVV